MCLSSCQMGALGDLSVGATAVLFHMTGLVAGRF
jgi:hypothetical protein